MTCGRLPLLKGGQPGGATSDWSIVSCRDCLRIGVANGNADARATLKAAKNLGSQGYLIHQHPSGSVEEKLIVVGQFRDTKLQEPVRKVFDDFKVRLVLTGELEDFVREIKRDAH